MTMKRVTKKTSELKIKDQVYVPNSKLKLAHAVVYIYVDYRGVIVENGQKRISIIADEFVCLVEDTGE